MASDIWVQKTWKDMQKEDLSMCLWRGKSEDSKCRVIVKVEKQYVISRSQTVLVVQIFKVTPWCFWGMPKYRSRCDATNIKLDMASQLSLQLRVLRPAEHKLVNACQYPMYWQSMAICSFIASIGGSLSFRCWASVERPWHSHGVQAPRLTARTQLAEVGSGGTDGVHMWFFNAVSHKSHKRTRGNSTVSEIKHDKTMIKPCYHVQLLVSYKVTTMEHEKREAPWNPLVGFPPWLTKPQRLRSFKKAQDSRHRDALQPRCGTWDCTGCPLVDCHITMENGLKQWIFPLNRILRTYPPVT